jgi:Protein of unknown function (DUF3662)/FHA domain
VTVLRNIEHKIEGLFEGLFGRAFRTNVQPVELARKLAKEMDDHRVVSVSRVYVPNEFTVYLCTEDRKQFESYEASLLSELQEYLTEHSRRENYALLSKPTVLMETDDDLEVGEFGIATRMASVEGLADDVPAQAAPGATMVYRPEDEPEAEPEPAAAAVALTVNGKRHEVAGSRALLGRSKECDIRISDPNVSRRHAEVRQEGSAYWIVDLDSTNGVLVNGRRQKRAKLDDGDKITLGSTDIVFNGAPS